MFGGIFGSSDGGGGRGEKLTIANWEGQQSEGLRNILQCIEQPSTTKTLLIPKVHSAES